MKPNCPQAIFSTEQIDIAPTGPGMSCLFCNSVPILVTHSKTNLRRLLKKHKSRGLKFTDFTILPFHKKHSPSEIKTLLREAIDYYQPIKNKRYNSVREPEKMSQAWCKLRFEHIQEEMQRLEREEQALRPYIDEQLQEQQAEVPSSQYRAVSVAGKLIDPNCPTHEYYDSVYIVPRPEPMPPSLELPVIHESKTSLTSREQTPTPRKPKSWFIRLFSRDD